MKSKAVREFAAMAMLAASFGGGPVNRYIAANDGEPVRFNTYHNLSPRMAKARKLRKQSRKGGAT
jgi:hypothetical protein